MTSRIDLTHRRVLLVEDEMLVSLLIEDVLTSAHCVIVGPYDRVDRALEAAQSQDIDVAILDINLAGKTSFTVAEALAQRNIPFLFLSGYGRSAMPANQPGWTVCSKPFTMQALIGMLADKLAKSVQP